MIDTHRRSKPRRLREAIRRGRVVLPGAFNAAVALLAERAGFDGLYISGAAMSNAVRGVPDIGLLTLEEAAREAGYIARSVNIPALADADTGYGLAVGRCVRAFERAGVAGIHIEDQVSRKRCGHLAGKRLVTAAVMVRKLTVARRSRRDRDFLIVARTDARGAVGFGEAVDRARLYRAAGADVIFPEALESRAEFIEFAKHVPGPLLANMTEFGRSPYLTAAEFAEIGYAIVIFPMTAFRVAMRAVNEILDVLRASGSQRSFLDRMQTRKELYDLLGYNPDKPQ